MIRLDEALDGVVVLGLDTAPFIYLIERNPTYLTLVRTVFHRINAGSLFGHSSVITLTEVLSQPLRLGNTGLAQRYRRFLTSSRNLTLNAISAEIAEHAADLRARYRLRTPDALQIATALNAGCTAFLTNDAQLQRVQELSILVLDSLEL